LRIRTLTFTKFVSASFGFAALLAAILALPAAAQQPRKWNFRAAHYEVHATVELGEQRIAARARVEFEALEPSRTLEAELHSNMRIAEVLDNAGKPLPFERTDEPMILRVTLPEPVPAGQKVAVTFHYSGLLASEEGSPVRGVKLAFVGQQDAYLLQPARWFPLTGFPGNRYTSVFHLAVPEGVAVFGTGKPAPPQVEEPPPVQRPAPGKAPAAAPPPVPAAPRVVYSFRSDRPDTGGTFVAGNVQVVPVSAEGLNIPVYTRAALAQSARAYGESLAKIVNHFSAEFGPITEPGIAIGQLPEDSVPAFSAPGLVLLNVRQWDPNVNYRLLAQMAARQWWENEVLPATPADMWLADGLARYSEGLYVAHLSGEEGMLRALEDFAIGALMYEDAAPIAQAGRLQPFTSEYRSVVMNKGAMVFHMLRHSLGDEAFEELLREYYAKFRGRTARLEDFQTLAETIAEKRPAADGRPQPNLRAFFAQWLNSTGVPEFQIEFVVYRTPKGFRIVGKVRQDLETFRMPVGVRVETEGNPELKTIEVAGSNSDFTIETFGRPKPGGLVLDPQNQLLKSSARLRVRAAIARGEELAQSGRFFDASRHYLSALEVQKNNSLAHFRLGEASFFQKNYQAAANAFRDAIDGDLDPSYKWVEVWSHIYLGKIFDLTGQRERAVNEYSKAIELADDTGGAQAEARRYLNAPFSETAGRSASSSTP